MMTPARRSLLSAAARSYRSALVTKARLLPADPYVRHRDGVAGDELLSGKTLSGFELKKQITVTGAKTP